MRRKKPVIYLIVAGSCMLAMVLGIAFIIGYYADRQRRAELYESLQSSVAAVPVATSEAAAPAKPLSVVAEASPAPDIPDDQYLLRTVDFTALQQEANPDIYAWIYIPGTGIDYPILQHPSDDTYYLNYNLDGSKGYPGCIYTERENALDFSDFHTVIYGHNMKNGTMFHDLHSYEDETFLPEHPHVYIYTPDRILRYRIFAAYRYDDRHLLYSFDYESEAGRSGYLSEIFRIKSMSAVLDNQVKVTADDRIITLSTCMGSQTENRYLVQAVLINDLSTADINE